MNSFLLISSALTLVAIALFAIASAIAVGFASHGVISAVLWVLLLLLSIMLLLLLLLSSWLLLLLVVVVVVVCVVIIAALSD